MTRLLTGTVFRLVKTAGGRRMVTAFTREAGKIGAGTTLSERSKSKSALAVRPFSLSEFCVEERRKGFFTIVSATVIDSRYSLAEVHERYAEASFALEFSDKLLPEGVVATEVYDLLEEHLSLLSERKRDFRLQTLSFLTKLLDSSGVLPGREELEPLLLPKNSEFDILSIIDFLRTAGSDSIANLTLPPAKCDAVFAFLRSFAEEQLDIGTLKTDVLL